jgi:hypothetical protein
MKGGNKVVPVKDPGLGNRGRILSAPGRLKAIRVSKHAKAKQPKTEKPK